MKLASNIVAMALVAWTPVGRAAGVASPVVPDAAPARELPILSTFAFLDPSQLLGIEPNTTATRIDNGAVGRGCYLQHDSQPGLRSFATDAILTLANSETGQDSYGCTNLSDAGPIEGQDVVYATVCGWYSTYKMHLQYPDQRSIDIVCIDAEASATSVGEAGCNSEVHHELTIGDLKQLWRIDQPDATPFP